MVLTLYQNRVFLYPWMDMPVLWRYLAANYLKVFILTVGAFLAILLTSRLEEIAHFASFGADFLMVIYFTLLQIPYILPIAIPVACLLASALLMTRLSADHELTAMRSAGFSLQEISTPVIVVSLLLSVLNFYIVSEVATFSHLQTNLLKSELRSVNPLLLLHNKHLMRVKGVFYDVLGPSKMGQLASTVVLALPSERRENLNLLFASKLETNENKFSAENISLITPIGIAKNGEFSDLILENIGSSSSAIHDFADLIQKKVTQFHEDHLSLSLLRLKLAYEKEKIATLEDNEINQVEIKAAKKSIRMIYSEFARRLSAALAPFTFTMLGLAFGMSISRLKKKTQWAFPIILAALYLFCFFAAKSLENQVGLAYALFLLPHLVIIAACIWKMERISHGVGA